MQENLLCEPHAVCWAAPSACRQRQRLMCGSSLGATALAALLAQVAQGRVCEADWARKTVLTDRRRNVRILAEFADTSCRQAGSGRRETGLPCLCGAEPACDARSFAMEEEACAAIALAVLSGAMTVMLWP